MNEAVDPGLATLDGYVLYRRSATCLWRSFGDEVLISGPDAQFRALAGTGAVVWRLLQAPMSGQEIVATLAEAYRSAPEVVARDVMALLGELARLGYIDEVSDA